MDGQPSSKNLTKALSVCSLANICFEKCIVKSNGSKKHEVTPKTQGVLNMLNIDEPNWLLSEKQTVCVHNCSKSYAELKNLLSH